MSSWIRDANHRHHIEFHNQTLASKEDFKVWVKTSDMRRTPAHMHMSHREAFDMLQDAVDDLAEHGTNAHWLRVATVALAKLTGDRMGRGVKV